MPDRAEIADLLRRLKQTPQHFMKVAAGLAEEELKRPPAPGEWSVHELLAHLRGCLDIQGGWIMRILAEDTPTIRYVSARTGMKKTGYETADFASFLESYEATRRDFIKALSGLRPQDWDRRANFTGTKPGWVQTVFDIANGMARHEHAHYAQIADAATRR